VCGIPKDLPQPQFSSADVWILLDGIVCLYLRYPVGRNIVEEVNVPIPAQVRFLTLVTTCSGRADYSWILFGDPFLELGTTVQKEPITEQSYAFINDWRKLNWIAMHPAMFGNKSVLPDDLCMPKKCEPVILKK
jgi:hypothetical protein